VISAIPEVPHSLPWPSLVQVAGCNAALWCNRKIVEQQQNDAVQKTTTPCRGRKFAFVKFHDLYWRSPESSELYHTSGVPTKRICSHTEGWWEERV